MKTISILFLASIILMAGCKEEEQTQVCSCSLNTNVTTGFDSSFVHIGHGDSDTFYFGSETRDTIELGDQIQFIAPSGNWVSYAWTPSSELSCNDCANPIATPNFTTEYTLSVIDTGGFSHEYTALIIVRGDTMYPNPVIYIPNIFTPNSDGRNDIFIVYGQGFAAFHLQIKDGSNVVFESHDQSVGWDGTINGSFISDCSNFNYIIDVTFTTGTTYHIDGEVTVYRSLTNCPDNIPDCRFGDQFDGSGFNPTLPSGEIINC